jgi:hypothetical protein
MKVRRRQPRCENCSHTIRKHLDGGACTGKAGGFAFQRYAGSLGDCGCRGWVAPEVLVMPETSFELGP